MAGPNIIAVCWVASLPTSVREIPSDSSGVHESMLRAYHILMLVEIMLRRGDSRETILDLISAMRGEGKHG